MFCYHCGAELTKDDRYCANCGAQIQQQPTGQGSQPSPNPNGECCVRQPAEASAPRKKTFSPKIALIAGSCVLAAGLLVFGIYRLILKPAAPRATGALSDNGKTVFGATLAPEHSAATQNSSGSSHKLPQPMATQHIPVLPRKTIAPAKTPASEETWIDYSYIIGHNDVPGLTESEAIDYLGDPQSREIVDAPDGAEIFLNYGSFILKYYSEDEQSTGTCYEVQIVSTPCPVWAFGLESGMDASKIEDCLSVSPFELTYQDSDEMYCVYSDLSTGHDLFINLADGLVWDISIFYSP